MQTARTVEITPAFIAGETPAQPVVESTIPASMRQSGTSISLSFPDERIATIPLGRVYSNKGLVVTPDQTQIQDFSGGAFEGLFPHPFVCHGRLPKAQRVHGKVAVLTTGLGDCNYYHWTVENLAQLRQIEQAGVSPNSYSISGTHRFHRECLELFGVPAIVQIRANEFTHVQADELIVPSVLRSEITPESATFLYQRMADAHWSKTRAESRLRLYIARRRSGWRYVENESKLLAALSEFGFERYFLEDHPVRAQMELFQQAEFVIGPHGAGLTNLVYCNAGTKVIEIGSPIRPLGFFYFISHHRGLRYLNYFGKAVDAGRDESNIHVDVEELVRHVRAFDQDGHPSQQPHG